MKIYKPAHSSNKFIHFPSDTEICWSQQVIKNRKGKVSGGCSQNCEAVRILKGRDRQVSTLLWWRHLTFTECLMVSTYLPFDFLFSAIGALANDRKILRQMNASAIEAAACDVCSKSSSIEKSDVGSCFPDI